MVCVLDAGSSNKIVHLVFRRVVVGTSGLEVEEARERSAVQRLSHGGYLRRRILAVVWSQKRTWAQTEVVESRMPELD